jgi:hypothetical protein
MDEMQLGGRRFRVIDFNRRTVMNDHYLMRTIRLTGVDKALPEEDESQAGYLVRLQTMLLDSGYVPDLLGGYLLPIDKAETDWTVEMARETSGHVGKCQTQEDRELVMRLAIEVVFGFFRQGLDWLKSLQSSSVGTSPVSKSQMSDATVST